MRISKQEAKERLCLALDVSTLSEAEGIVAEVKDFVGVFKVGMELFSAEGPRVVRRIRDLGGQVFLDLKYHDIPNTVAQAGRVATRLGVAFFNVHASGGKQMMEATMLAVKDEAKRTQVEAPKVLAVTVLTSLSAAMLREEMGVGRELEEQVVAMATLAKDSGLDGVVASPKEISSIRQTCGRDFIIVTPGIRPAGAEKQDQQRVTTPREAIERGADYIVVGRPIHAASDRVAACRGILAEMAGE